MKTIFLLASILCASPAFAIHLYADYHCKNGNLELNYDGPGSNYAFGGFGHFYITKAGKTISVLSLEDISEGDSVGDVVAEEILGVLFDLHNEKATSPITSDKKAGDKCEPGEIDYVHTEWNSTRTIVIKEILPQASQDLGIKAGEKLTFTCQETQDTPITCPDSGQYSEDDLN
ncbi:hypothetical protein [Bdellovibrio sp. HCB337]|uniref:hypothetical protein n=1 Tax=Bdellovibrio sp. HCB337 TaxID=3394358 RepID=UPI0039A507B5